MRRETLVDQEVMVYQVTEESQALLEPLVLLDSEEERENLVLMELWELPEREVSQLID